MNTYNFHINLYDLAFLGTVFVGLTFALLLWFTKNINQVANRFLGLALAIIVSLIARILGIDIQLSAYLPHWDWLPLQFSLALGPLIYFYVLKITRPDYEFGLKDMLHFSPLLLELGAQVLEIRESASTGAATYNTSLFQELNPVLQLLAFVSVITYLCLSYRLIEVFYRRLKFNNVSDRYRYELRWLKHSMIGFSLLWSLWIPYMVIDYFYYHNQLSIHAYYPLYFLLATIFIRIAILSFSRPDVKMPVNAHVFSRPLLPAELKQKGAWLKKAVKDNNYYQDPELSLSSLAEKVNLTTHELSRIINMVLRKSFHDFINEYRIDDVARRMRDPAYDHMTLLGIALESGFNSKNTFNRAFKQFTGINPAEYKNHLKKEGPSYNMGRYPRFTAVISTRQATPVWTDDKLNRNIMFKNYFKTGWRSLIRNKSYAAINIIGLAVGIAACLLISLIVHFETSFDDFHLKKDHIYRVVTIANSPQGPTYDAGVPFPTAEALRLDYPELAKVASMLRVSNAQITVTSPGLKAPVMMFKEKSDLFFAEPGIFEIFDFKYLGGGAKSALTEPNSVVLTKSIAEKYFGDWKTAIGRSIIYENKNVLKVTGVLQNPPVNTDIPLGVVISYVTLKSTGIAGNLQDWTTIYGTNYCFIVAPGNFSADHFNSSLISFVKKHKPADFAKKGMALQPLGDMHFNGKFGTYNNGTFSKELIATISLIGVFLLVIACINFVNLATAQAVKRSKEVGVRKVLGGSRLQLMLQFIGETLLITVFAVTLAVIIAEITLSSLNSLLATKIDYYFITDQTVILFLLAVILCVTLLSGIYPALILSGYNPVSALKNRAAAIPSGSLSLRRVLVILQFCIAQVLIIGTVVIISQMRYFRHASLGFDQEAIVTVPVPTDSASQTKYKDLRDELLRLGAVKSLSFSFSAPSDDANWTAGFNYNNSPQKADFGITLKWADADFFKTYGLKLIAGHFYEASDTIRGYVVNQTFLKKLGIRNPQEVLGKNITPFNDKSKRAPIVGVVNDFNVASLRHELPPVVLASWANAYQKINIKLKPGDPKASLAAIEKLWSKAFPDHLFEYKFIDDTITDFYKRESQLSQLYQIFAGIAIFISCLGLYGLVSFMAAQRTKEVGIRKTLGASAGQIVYLFSKEFTVLIMIAFTISAPVGYYFLHRWLQDFSYRITIGAGVFILAIVSSIIIAWLTVGYKAIQAALANPVKSLRSE